MSMNLYEIVKDYYDSSEYINVIIDLDKSTVKYFCNDEEVITLNFKFCNISSDVICELSKIEDEYSLSIDIIYKEKLYKENFFYSEIFLANSESEEDYIEKIYINTVKLILDVFFDFDNNAEIDDYDTAKYYYHEICTVFKESDKPDTSEWEIIGKALSYILDNIEEVEPFKNDINDLINFFN